jgi:hypothetical protein
MKITYKKITLIYIKMVNYQNGKIYTIRNRNDSTLIYVGSTTTSLCLRMAEHRKMSLKYCENMFYSKIEDWKDWYIELYEIYPCNSREELFKREGEIIREIGTLNSRIAGRTHKEWRDDNVDKVRDKNKQYYEQNKDVCSINNRKYRENNQDKIREYMKEYKEKNKDKLKEYKREYQIQYRLKKKSIPLLEE